MKKAIWIMALLVGFSVPAYAVNPGEIIYIAPMENSMDKFISAEILDRKLPVGVTTDENKADYVLVGTAIDKGSNHKWYDVAFGTSGMRDSIQASVTLIRKSDKVVVWADSQGDRSFWWGSLKRGGERKAALRIVKSMKKDLFKK